MMVDKKIEKTKKMYGFLWRRSDKESMLSGQHFYDIQGLIGERIVRGRMGIDIGSGCGYDTYAMAADNPSVRIASLDISDGIKKTKELTHDLKNVWHIRGSVLDLPVSDNIFDFAYSFGVLHHTSDPGRGVREIYRIIRPGAPAYLYLYEDHSDNQFKFFSVKIITFVRRITTRMHPKVIYALSYLISPFAVLFFSYPSMVFRKFKITRGLADKMPFNFGTHPFSVVGDLYDRFSAPIERRFNKQEIIDLLQGSSFIDIKIDKLKAMAGWVVWAHKR